MATKNSLHRLIDELPESELAAAERFLHYLRATADPVLRALLKAPPDNEPETEEERQTAQEAREELARGRCGRWRRCGEIWGGEQDSRLHHQAATAPTLSPCELDSSPSSTWGVSATNLLTSRWDRTMPTNARNARASRASADEGGARHAKTRPEWNAALGLVVPRQYEYRAWVPTGRRWAL
jgi:hypothetical protein